MTITEYDRRDVRQGELILCFVIFLACLPISVLCAVVTWDDDSSDGLWSTPTNWSTDNVPGPADDVIFNSTSTNNCTADSVSNNLGSITVSASYSNTVTFKKNAVDAGMNLTVTNITINAGKLVFEGDTTAIGDGTAGNKFGIGYSIAVSNIYIAAGASMNSDKQGFPVNNGPGKGLSSLENGSGGGYGGRGGKSSGITKDGGVTYGSATSPTALGSGGGQFSWGGVKAGGAIKITASGTVTVNGSLSANSGNGGGNSGGGAGGSIWIASGVLTGPGTISANGGYGASMRGGGGGGRIDISGTTNNFSGSLQVKGANTVRMHPGRAGTIVFPQSAGTGLILDNFSLTNDLTLGNDIAYTFGTLTVNNGATLSLDGNPYATNSSSGGTGSSLHGTGLTITATNIEIKTGGTISAKGMGFGQIDGPGKGATSGNHGSGGGHAGKGNDDAWAVPGGSTYGNITEPTAMGSGAGHWYGASGGGAIRLIVTNLTINGLLYANGDSQDTWEAAGGAGGSIWITTQMIAGTNGLIAANGGNGATSRGGGGGGCIKIEYVTNNAANPFDLNNNMKAIGGEPTAYLGGAGTIIVLKTGDQTYGDLIVDNNNYDTVACYIQTNNFTGTPPTLTFDSLTIRKSAILQIPEDCTLVISSCFINTNATFTGGTNSTVILTTTNEATVSGNNDFWNLTSTTSGKRINFEAGSTNSVAGMLRLKFVKLYSTSDGSYWYLNVSGTQDVANVSVHDSDASGGQTIMAYYSLKKGWNNPNWEFIGVGAIIVIF